MKRKLILLFATIGCLTACNHIHEFTPWSIDVDSTCKVAGSASRICECGKIETMSLPLKSHVESNWIIDIKPTYQESGKQHIECDKCHTVLLEQEIAPIEVNYYSSEELEEDLNNGGDAIGKTALIMVNGINPSTVFGYMIYSGEHLNFASERNPKVEVNDVICIKIDDVISFLGSWIIRYQMM